MCGESPSRLPRKKAKFAWGPRDKMTIAIAAIGEHYRISDISRSYGISRPTIYAWCRRLKDDVSIQAVFGDEKGRETFLAVLAERDELREKLRARRKREGKIVRRYGIKKCPTCGQQIQPK